MKNTWLKNYPDGVPAEINNSQLTTLNDVISQSISEFSSRVAFENFGCSITYSEFDTLSTHFSSFLINELKLKKGDRIAIQLPNILQYPVVMYGALKAGLIIVNTNPLYTEREMEHQFKDSGASAIVILNHFTNKLENILKNTKIKHVIETGVGDLLGFPKKQLINSVLKYVKKEVCSHSIKNTYKFNQCIDLGKSHKTTQLPEVSKSDLAFLQYTGGTTGVAKGAELKHENIVANMLQIVEWMKPRLLRGEEIILTPLPLYHIFSLTLNCFGFLYYGGTNVLITNPRDLNGFIKLMKKRKFTLMSGVNTLFNALINHPDFKSINFSNLKLSVAGGTALQKDVADRWAMITKTAAVEGYGLTETSPVVSCNPVDGKDQTGTIGIPLPSTLIKLINDEGVEVKRGESGELCVKGPQVMKGYWNHPEATKNTFTDDGWLKTGDVAIQLETGFFKIVDRKKDMILVSGFNVFPNEIEDVIALHPKVLEVAAIGVPNKRSGEAVKVYIVKKEESLTKEEIKNFAKKQLTGYKTPDQIEFKNELPKSNVGKILRRKLKEEHLKNL